MILPRIHTMLVTMGFLSFLFGSCTKPSPAPNASGETASKFRAGQVWAFKTPPGQPNAKLTVLRVERGEELGTIVHIALSGVSYGNGKNQIQHLPFAESAIEESVTTLERESGPVPDFAEGYGAWREAYDAGGAGVFTIPVAEMFEIVTGVVRDLSST